MSAPAASRVVIIDSGCANVASIAYALDRLNTPVAITSERREIERASHVVLPGVGTAGAFMARVRERGLAECLRNLRVPCLGICLGMQLMFESSAEGDTPALGIFPGRAEMLPGGPGLTIPHMGWNQLELEENENPLTAGIAPLSHAYFVHSYYVRARDIAIATARHGVEIAAVVSRGNFHGCQFHPERSARTGATLLENFLSLS